MTTAPFRFPLIPILLFFAILAGNVSAAEETGKQSLAILPFTVNATKDISYLQAGIRNMLASRLAADTGLSIIDQSRVDQQAKAAGDTKQQNLLIQLGNTLQTDYLLSGTLTAIGQSLSLDAKLYPVKDPGKPVESFYASAPTEDDIITAVDSLAWDIAEKSFGKQRPVPKYPQQAQMPGNAAMPMQGIQPPALPTGEPQGDPAYRTAHPDRQFMGNYQGGNYGGGSPILYPSAITSAFGFTKTQNFDYAMQGFDIGDIDGDGKQDVVIASKDKIYAYHLTDNRLVPFGEIEFQSRYKIISLDLADLNGNGKAEIYVTGVDWITPNSMGLEWQGKEFDYLFKNERWYVRTMYIPGPGKMLIGQKAQINEAFASGIYQLRVTDNILQHEEKLSVPDSLNLYDFALADLDGDGKTEVIALDGYDKLKVLQAGGKQLWKSDENFGGSLVYVGGENPTAKSDKNMSETRVKERIYIHSRILVQDVNNDNQPDIVINKNLSTASRVLENMKNYPSGEIHALAWNGIGLTDLWRTRKIDGYVASYQLDRDPENKDMATLFVGIITNTGWLDIFTASDSTVLMYPLDLRKAESQDQNVQQGYQYMGK
ncbi:MAG: VCBS repeat-containing protein [Proteobacteria bacterium]|nr:VCBS repeat-containing protein [Pseudomonadota bacterium]